MNKSKWSNTSKSIFLQRLGTSLKQGYPLVIAMELLAYHEKTKGRETIERMVKDLRAGNALHDVALRQAFPKDICGFIYFSEQHGDLALGLIEGGSMLQKREQSKSKLQQLLRYPIFLLWVVMLLFFILFKYLYPQFRRIYASFDIQLPLITRILLKLNESAIPIVVFIASVIVMIILFSLLFFRNSSNSTVYTSLLKIPMLSSVIRLYLTYYLSLHLGSLLKVGMSINHAFYVFSNQTFLPFFQSEADRITKSLKSGESLDESFERQPFYTNELASVIAHGQMNGLLGKELFDYSQLLIQTMEEKLNRIYAVIQPLLLIFIGGFTLLLFLSILLPIFQMMNGF